MLIRDKGVGISAVTDTTCATRDGVGYKGNSVCRFCKTKMSSQASQFLLCRSFTPATSAPTPVTPVTATPIATITVTCVSLVSAKNVDLGFSAYSDAACSKPSSICPSTKLQRPSCQHSSIPLLLH